MEADIDRRVEDRVLTPAHLKELSVRSNTAGLVRAVSHYAAIGLVGTLIWLVMKYYGPLQAIPLIVVQGYLVAFLFMPLHEAAHKTVFRDRSLNVLLGHLSALTIGLPYEYYALFHWDHHRFTQDPERDPELLNAVTPRSDTGLAVAYSGIEHLAKRILFLFRRAITGEVAVPWIPQSKREMVIRESRAYVLVYFLLFAASVTLSTTVLLWTWLVPLILGQIFLRPYLYAEHTGCSYTRSPYENTRTTYTGSLTKWFAWNMPFHAEHHAYPSVPFHALPKLNETIATRIVHPGHGYVAVTRETWSWFRRTIQSGSEKPRPKSSEPAHAPK